MSKDATCPRCGKTDRVGYIRRFHGENCRRQRLEVRKDEVVTADEDEEDAIEAPVAPTNSNDPVAVALARKFPTEDIEKFVDEIYRIREACDGTLADALLDWAERHDDTYAMETVARMVKQPKARQLKRDLLEESKRLKMVREVA
jgi:hypothetical protein